MNPDPELESYAPVTRLEQIFDDAFPYFVGGAIGFILGLLFTGSPPA